MVKIYYNCYKYWKKCTEKGDLYDNKCDSCIDGFVFNEKNNFKNCISLSDSDTEKINYIDDNKKESDYTRNL